MKIYDLRSDTITKPDEAMRKAMYEAECGDDVYMEDPTVNKLQEMAAEITGKEKAIFVSSGTMGNLIPTMILGEKGKQIILEKECHIIHYELGGIASISGLMPMVLEAKRGILTKELVAPYIKEKTYSMPSVAMIEVENTHNRHGGSVYNIDTLKELYNFADSKNIHMHIDGARIFNAATAIKSSVKDITKYSHSVTFCLSKGLGAPVGSLLCANKDFIDEAFTMRKLIGGGMRQSGIIAAAGIYALKHNVKDLEKDHIHAKKIANAVNEGGLGHIDLKEVETNIVICETKKPANEIVESLEKLGVKSSTFGDYKVRFVTHRDINAYEIDEVCKILSSFKL